MSDGTINRFLGTMDTAAMAAYTPAAATPASGPDSLILMRNSDDGMLYFWDGAAFDAFSGGGTPGGIDKEIQWNDGGSFEGVTINATATNKFLRQVSSGTPTLEQVADADLSTTDVTTNNVTSTKHGFAPKSGADATTFLNGAATPAYAQVKDSDLATTDVTNNDVSSTKHGFAPKSPGNAAHFLNGAATPAFAAVTDANLSTSDVTDNDVSITKHGFAPKAPNDASEYLDGTGSWSTPPGGSVPPALNVFLAERFY